MTRGKTQSSTLGKRKTTPMKQPSKKKKSPHIDDTEQGCESTKEVSDHGEGNDMEQQGDRDAEGSKDKDIEGSKKKDVDNHKEKEEEPEDIIPQAVTKSGGSEFDIK
ncbi:hypothetical protein GOP47_0005492 [Adiantum capillus-veneris]|uniref:Uncharacterized protein n=1 Tax=Adiantum capillus-veneris TaxID=13818 RepID=A0A9D4V6D1_ADICA|nr:hypothetical protein GOP47_0005492 [Adiantum capillus-veneris]